MIILVTSHMYCNFPILPCQDLPAYLLEIVNPLIIVCTVLRLTLSRLTQLDTRVLQEEKNCETGLASAIHRNMTLTSEISSQMHSSLILYSQPKREIK